MDKARLPLNAKLLLYSTFITYIGNGMYTITIGLFLYEATGKVTAFGFLILFEFIINTLLQLFAGSVVDRGNPKHVAFLADLIRGIAICLLIILMNEKNILLIVIALTIIINLAKPFYRSAIFSLGPLVTNDKSSLIKFNTLSTSFIQSGVLIGVALAAPINQYINPQLSLFFNGLSFIIAGLIIGLVKLNLKKVDDKKSPLADWTEIILLLKNKPSLLYNIIFSSGDFIVVSLINLMLVPFIFEYFNNSRIMLSIFDSSFAIGSLIMASLILAVIRRIKPSLIKVFALFLQGTMFLLLINNASMLLVILVMFALGVFNSMSIGLFMSSIQGEATGNTKGRISALRYMILSILTSITIPIASFFFNKSLEWGLFFSFFLCLLYTTSMILIKILRYFKISPWVMRESINK